jgi:hypothetical protein
MLNSQLEANMTLTLSVALLYIMPYGDPEEDDPNEREVNMLFTEVEANFSVLASGEITIVENGAEKTLTFTDTAGRQWSVTARMVNALDRPLHDMMYLLHSPYLTAEVLERIQAL